MPDNQSAVPVSQPPTDTADRREAFVIFDEARTALGLQNKMMDSDTYKIALHAIGSLIAGPLPEGYMLVKRGHIEAAAREFSLFAPGNPATAILQALVRPTGES